MPPSAACVIVDPGRYSRHETVLQRSKAAGACHSGPRCAQKGSCKDLLGVLAHHKALAQAPERDRQPGAEEGRARTPRAQGCNARAAWLPEQLKDNPDLTLQEHCEA